MTINILLLIKCNYTVIGLKELFYRSNESNYFKVISDLNDISYIEGNNEIDVVITESGRYPLEVSEALMIPQSIDCRSIILVDNISQTEKNFYKRAGFHYLLANKTTFQDLQRVIFDYGYRNKKNAIRRISYSKKEREILYRLLRGENMKYISSELNISYKMVSHYKNSALYKTGAKSIIDIASGGGGLIHKIANSSSLF
ncbi:helix-turn-helix transcriptional regulator [Type-D symbiont of Plautia stali]|uniref:helix-turn-helix transcriptional regulator n=1 Tax=Type-D symbiont of Plautia stali TaxID=1560356 RepID=UPI00073F72AC|nr:LuxR C-terminal-related transcriptional regulator [Type-D symbiont of Plautia stali]